MGNMGISVECVEDVVEKVHKCRAEKIFRSCHGRCTDGFKKRAMLLDIV